jgi:hypothetical protein
MVNDTVPLIPAIGACCQCNQLFLVTHTAAACLLCGRPPDLTLPFGLSYYIEAAVQATLETEAQERALEPVETPLAAPGNPPLPADVPPITARLPLQCPHCGEVFEVRTSDAHLLVIPPPPAPPAEEAAPEVLPTTAAAPPPDEPEPAPAMAHDVVGNPIEGPPVGPQGPAPEEPLP